MSLPFEVPRSNGLPYSFDSRYQQPLLQSPNASTIPYFANAVYYPNGGIYRQQPPSALSLDIISHVFYAFAWPNPDGTISLSDEHADIEIEVDGTQGCISALTALKLQHPRLRVILSIGGGGQGSAHFASVANNNTTRHVFARSARDLVHMHDFDGVDIDWEHPANPQEGADYILLLAATRTYLPAPAYTLTSALPAGEWVLRNINVGMAAQYLDFLNLMAYDFSGPWTERSGHHAQLYSPRNPHNESARSSCHSAVSYLRLNGVPPGKILLGIPVYGRSFPGADGIGQRFARQGAEEGTFEYRDLPRPGSTESIDPEVIAAFSVGGDGGFVSYDNPQTVQMKATYARSQMLGGLFYWTGTYDALGPRSLIENGYNALHDQ